MVVRYAPGNPQSPHIFRTRTRNLEKPEFPLIGNRQAFPPITITILFCQASHQQDRLACRTATLQSNPLQILDMEQTFRITQFLPPDDSRFSHRQLFLIHTRVTGIQIGKCRRDLRNRPFQHHTQPITFTFRVTNIPVNVDFCRVRPVLRRHNFHPSTRSSVASLGSHNRTIGRR